MSDQKVQELKKVVQSPNDPREYKAIRLQNSLEVILISDPECDKSAASLNVNVGQLEDPEERQGIAHFLEHMLFQGTKTFPDEGEFDKYLTQNGGSHNAYTDLMQTVYYFQCSNKGFDGALDRFSRFFYESLFDPESADREMKAVDSEHQKNIQQDMWRGYQLLRHLSKKGNPYNKFGTGDLSTLQHPNIRDDLLKFYEKYYSANLMKLVVNSNESIEEIEKSVIEKFSPIVNKNYQRQSYGEVPFDKQNLGKIIKFQPIKDKNKLVIYWVIEDQLKYYKNCPSNYLSHIIGHEGRNSLYSKLKSEGLILELGCGKWDQMNLFSYFFVEIELTQKGIQNYEYVLQLVFSFIQMLKTKGPQKHVHDELKIVKELKFQNLDKQKGYSYVQSLADRMLKYDIEDVIKFNNLIGDFDETLLQKTMGQLTMDNCLIKISSKTFDDSIFDQTEPIYGTKYNIEDISEKIRCYYSEPLNVEGIDYPPSNEFLPKNMDLITQDFTNLPEYPSVVLQTESSLVYYKQDNKFRTPKGVIYWSIYTNDNGFVNNPKSNILAELWIEVFKESISEVLYEAEMAYLETYFQEAYNRLSFRIAGFTDSFGRFLHMFIKKICEFDPSQWESKFNDKLEHFENQYKNFPSNNPYQQVYQLRDKIFLTGQYDPELMLELIQQITFQDLLNFNKTWLLNVCFEWLFAGNISKEQVIQIVQHSEEQFIKNRNAKILPKGDIVELRNIQITSNPTIFWSRELPENESNSAVSVHYQVGTDNLVEKLQLDFVSKMVKSPFFDTMRTKQGLGYVVFSLSDENRGVYGFDFLIQSNVAGPHDLVQRIEIFVKEFDQEIENIKPEEFEQYKHSIEDDLKQKADSVLEEAKRYWGEINKHRYQFNRREILIEKLQSITLDQVKQFYKRVFIDNPSKLEIMLLSPGHKEEDNKIKQQRMESNPNLKQAQSIEWIKKTSSLFPDYDAKL
ncbi:Metalloenzyme, LuxS/M16 peptidase-like protein [Pseudocohnilembus persalinus]|uniref:Metalloenzyme, LuxS/M16 peptidase-like protein n=1 Tax=Pseudocohnilembus persalinus TaxID=266149 RepID=A0A0V0Q7F7_PSEPJ|nr:Metalloenzyme, LuxS/M16 peptidase-like protein [Pseudocohnilembus persalinus]|eukprot:KRW98169.1 Metalloenzyme, LuxS/M16 peptidase-like protein [Pseudocohnilembus persalinus]